MPATTIRLQPFQSDLKNNFKRRSVTVAPIRTLSRSVSLFKDAATRLSPGVSD
jgi:hypothetical protein